MRKVALMMAVSLTVLVLTASAQPPDNLEVEIIDSLPAYGDSEGWVIVKLENYEPASHGDWLFIFWNLINVGGDPPEWDYWRWYQKKREVLSNVAQFIDGEWFVLVRSVHHPEYDPLAAGFFVAAGDQLDETPTCGDPGHGGEVECYAGDDPYNVMYPPDELPSGEHGDWDIRYREGEIPDPPQMSSITVPWFVDKSKD